MITAYLNDGGRLVSHEGLPAFDAAIVWIDLLNPDGNEEAQIEARLGTDVPAREEMEEIEISSRLYTEDGTLFMAEILPSHADGDHPDMPPCLFFKRRGWL